MLMECGLGSKIGGHRGGGTRVVRLYFSCAKTAAGGAYPFVSSGVDMPF